MIATAPVLTAAVALGGCAPWVERPFAGLRPERPRVAVRAPVATPAAPVATPAPSIPFATPEFCRGGMRRIESVTGSAIAIGPLVFADLGARRPALRFFPGSPPLTVPVIVPAGTRATIAVPLGMRRYVGLDSGRAPANTPAATRHALVCDARREQRVYQVSFVVDGARCVPVSVTVNGRTETRRIRFGVRRCRRG